MTTGLEVPKVGLGDAVRARDADFCGLLGSKSPGGRDLLTPKSVSLSLFEVSPKDSTSRGANSPKPMFHHQSTEQPPRQVFIFVNPKSGGGKANEYLATLGDQGEQNMLELKGGKKVVLRAFDIRSGKSGSKPGFKMLKEMASQAPALINVMVAGGDGTVMWAIQEMVATGVDVDKVVTGHIPFGTGNDFSRSTGWGPAASADLIGPNNRFLCRDVRRWLLAAAVDFDVWEVDVTAGGFAFAHNGKKGMTEQDKDVHGLSELAEGQWQMKKPMVNYFSLGQICRAGLGFEKNRTHSRFGNNVRYAFEGLKKLTLRPAPMVSDVVSDLTVTVGNKEVKPEVGPRFSRRCSRLITKDTLMSRVMSGASEMARGSPPVSRIGSDGSDQPTTQTSHISHRGGAAEGGVAAELLFLNIPSFAGGAHPWEWAPPAEAAKELKDCKQELGDGKLEVMTYSSGLSAAIDAANGKLWTPGRGAGRRLASAKGPFHLSFKSPEEAKYASDDGRVYFQVDGEFFLAQRPEHVKVSHWKTIKVAVHQAEDTDVCSQCACLGCH
eukprot:TRINITY_DN53036_c0_g1_i1.p1 TRINITY_DN53036_c0_g1~~TRINITY_DN53036_c0_g1_i1.p1  ORF type:complete len:551 (+),score=105.37 TRINITY_DN53036_c0_g1_i1:76-1728(+)